jgi:hypothetical protein
MTTIQNRWCVFFFVAVASMANSCNLWSGLDSPSGDAQLLSAARGCFDRGDYTCATEYYQALSNSQADVKTSETILMQLAQNGFLSISDLVASLGSGRGNGTTIVNIANKLVVRGNTTGANRTTIQSLYTQAETITETNLKGYTKFMVAFAMLTQTLASAAGGDGLITDSDFSSSSSCRTNGSCAGGDCAQGSSLLGTVASDGTLSNISTSTGWNTSPSLKKINEAANGVKAGLQDMGASTDDGVFQSINALSGVPAADGCFRQLILQTLFGSN